VHRRLLAGMWHLQKGSLELAEQELRQVLIGAEAARIACEFRVNRDPPASG